MGRAIQVGEMGSVYLKVRGPILGSDNIRGSV